MSEQTESNENGVPEKEADGGAKKRTWHYEVRPDPDHSGLRADDGEFFCFLCHSDVIVDYLNDLEPEVC